MEQEGYYMTLLHETYPEGNHNLTPTNKRATSTLIHETVSYDLSGQALVRQVGTLQEYTARIQCKNTLQKYTNKVVIQWLL